MKLVMKRKMFSSLCPYYFFSTPSYEAGGEEGIVSDTC